MEKKNISSEKHVQSSTIKSVQTRATDSMEKKYGVLNSAEKNITVLTAPKTASMSTPEKQFDITEIGILSSIVSSLSLRDAARASALSTSWRHIWTYVPVLKFDADNVFDAQTLSTLNFEDSHLTEEEEYQLCHKKRHLLNKKTDQFLHCIDSFLHQHQGAMVDLVSVRYFLNKAHSRHLDALVRFATSKAKRLLLNLDQHYLKFNIEPYDFPCHLLGPSSTLEQLSLIAGSVNFPSSYLKFPSKYDGFKRLEVLSFCNVGITEGDILNLLSNCSALQKLGIWKSIYLVSLSIPQPLSQLHFLLVKNCDQLREIKIDAISLNTLEYEGPPVDFKFAQSSQLKDADVCYKTMGRMSNMDLRLSKLSINLPQLRSLTLNITGVPAVESLPTISNTFIHLMRVNWQWNDGKMTHRHLTTLMDVAPFLEELKLHLSTRVVEPPPPELRKIRKRLPKKPHFHLKAIEIGGFYFDKWQIQLALYFLKNATELESMAIEKGRDACPEINGADIKNLNKQVPTNVKFALRIPGDNVEMRTFC